MLTTDLTELRRHAGNAKRAHLQLARQDLSIFNAYVLRDGTTNERITCSPVQEAWADMVAAHDNVVLWSHVEAGKTTQLSIGYTLFEIGRNPHFHIGILSDTAHQATRIVRTVGRYIEHSKEYHEVFPHIRRAEPWTSIELTVQRDTFSKDASIAAWGVHGDITGSRLNRIIIDDILDFENTSTADQRAKLIAWVEASVIGRLEADGKIVVVGNAWHPEDLMHLLAANSSWKSARFPVMDAKGNPFWPERWSRKRIEAKRKQFISPVEFARQMLCVARDDSTSRFKEEWLDLCKRRGENLHTVRDLLGLLDDEEIAQLTNGRMPTPVEVHAALCHADNAHYRIYTGVDLAVGESERHDTTALFTILAYPNGDRQVLNVEAGRWTFPDIIKRIIDVWSRFGGMFIVENVAAQNYVCQQLRHISAIPVVPFTTGKQKADAKLGIESMAGELANGKWIIPSTGGRVVDTEVARWVQEILYYKPNEHTGDRLMASWFARSGALSYELQEEMDR